MTIRLQPGSCLGDRGPKTELINGPVIKSKIIIHTSTVSVSNRQSRASTTIITCQTQSKLKPTRPEFTKIFWFYKTLVPQLHPPICFPHTTKHTFINCSFFTQYFQDILVGSSAKYILCYTSEWINKVPALKSTQVHSCDYLVTKLLIYR